MGGRETEIIIIIFFKKKQKRDIRGQLMNFPLEQRGFFNLALLEGFAGAFKERVGQRPTKGPLGDRDNIFI